MAWCAPPRDPELEELPERFTRMLVSYWPLIWGLTDGRDTV
jgi:hypothetical protein